MKQYYLIATRCQNCDNLENIEVSGNWSSDELVSKCVCGDGPVVFAGLLGEYIK